MNRWFPALAATPFLADWLFTAFTWLTWNKRPGLGQDSFLLYALDFKERGVLTLGNDHPLYPVILSLWISRDPAAFTWSKLFSLGWGAATVAAVVVLGRPLFGLPAALAGAVLLSVNWAFLSLSMSLRAEVLLPLFFFVTWAAAWRGFREDARWFALSGLAAGLALLTKGTGTLLALLFALSFAAAALRDRSLWKKAPLFAAPFLACAVWLWWANAAVLGDAFYNYSSRHAFWLDTWWEAGERPLAEQSLSGFVGRHGWLGVPTRLLAGMAGFAPLWLATLSPGKSFPIFWVLRWPLLAAALWAIWRVRRPAFDALRRSDGAALFTAALAGGFFVMFSWYNQVSPSERFVAPLSPMLLLLAAAALTAGWGGLAARLDALRPTVPWTRLAAGSLAGLTALGLVIKAGIWGVDDPFAADRPEPCYAEAITWAASRRGGLVYGGTMELPAYLSANLQTARGFPSQAPPPDLALWLRRAGIRSIVVDAETASRPFVFGHFEPAAEGGVRVLRLPRGWREAGRDRLHEPPHVVMLESMEPAPRNIMGR